MTVALVDRPNIIKTVDEVTKVISRVGVADAPDLSGYVTLATDQVITAKKTISTGGANGSALTVTTTNANGDPALLVSNDVIYGVGIRSSVTGEDSAAFYGSAGGLISNALFANAWGASATGVWALAQGASSVGVKADSAHISAIPLIARGAPSQTANLQDWRNSADTVLSAVDASGNIRLASDRSLVWGFAGDANAPSLFRSGVLQLDMSMYGSFKTGGLYANTIRSHSGSGSLITIVEAPPYGVQIDSGWSTNQPFRIKGYAGQTADLLQAQNSAGTVLTKVYSHGAIEVPAGTTLWSDGILYFSKSGIHIQGSASDGLKLHAGGSNRTIGLMAVTNRPTVQAGPNYDATIGNSSDAGTIAIAPHASSTLAFFGVGAVGRQGAAVPLNELLVNYGLRATQAAGDVLTIIKGKASQTGDLVQAQDSAGTVLASINSAGAGFFSGAFNESTTTPGAYIGRISGAGESGRMLFSSGSAPTNWQIDASYGTFRWYTPGVVQMSLNTSGQLLPRVGVHAGGAAALAGTQNSMRVLTASDTGLTIRGAASQTGNLQEWQNSAGAVLTSVTSTGDLYLGGSGATTTGRTITWGSHYDFAALTLYDGGDGDRYGWGLRAGEMQFFINGSAAANTAHYSWNSGGVFNASGTNEKMRLYGSSGDLSIGTTADLAKLAVVGSAASKVGVIVRGFASQTADLQQWQDSAGTNLAKMSETGALTLAGTLGSTTPGRPYITFGTEILIRNQTTVTQVPLAVRGMASQTGNLQEWQNSAGTVLSRMWSDGTLSLGGDLGITSDKRIYIGGVNGEIMHNNKSVFRPYHGGGYNTAIFSGNDDSAPKLTIEAAGNAIFSASIAATGAITARSGSASDQVQVGSIVGGYSGISFSTSTSRHLRWNGGTLEVVGMPFQVSTNGASAQGIVVKASAAQTAYLTDWRNSADSTIARLEADGRGRFNGVTADSASAFLGFLDAYSNLRLLAGAPALQFGHASQEQSTVGAAGGASALPATPSKYFKVMDVSGTTYVIPAYAAA